VKKSLVQSLNSFFTVFVLITQPYFLKNNCRLDYTTLYFFLHCVFVALNLPQLYSTFCILPQTTLVKLLVGDLKPTIGEAKITPGCRVAVVNQHHADQIDLDLTPLAFMKRQFPGDGSYNQDQKLRSHLASCGVGSDKMLVIVEQL